MAREFSEQSTYVRTLLPERIETGEKDDSAYARRVRAFLSFDEFDARLFVVRETCTRRACWEALLRLFAIVTWRVSNKIYLTNKIYLQIDYL